MANNRNTDDLKEIALQNNLSKRAINLISNFDLNTLNKLMDYLKRHKTFTNIDGIGKETNLELIEFINNLSGGIDKSEYLPNKKSYNIRDSHKIDFDKKFPFTVSLNDPDIFIKKYIYYCLLFVNERIGKALNEKLSQLSILKFISFFEKFNVANIKGIGSTKSSEYDKIFEHIKNIVGKAIKKPNYLRSYNFFPDSIYYHSDGQIDINNKLDQFIDKGNNKIKFFKLIQYLIDTQFFGDEKERIIFKNRIKITNKTTKKSMLEISKIFNLTGERVRQLNIDIENSFWNKVELLAFIIGKENIYLDDYLDNDSNLYEIVSLKVNKKEENDFSDDFIFRIIYFLVNDSYFPIFLKKNNIEKNFYISVNYSHINFDDFIANLQNMKETSDNFRIELNLKSYLKQFLSPEDLADNNLLDIFRKITEISCDAITDDLYNVEFDRNYRYMYEYALEVLQKEGTPLNLNQLYKKIEVKYPGIVKNIDALRGNIQICDKFIYFGRSSTYGLKVWEDQGLVKGGTIKQIVEEFLQSLDKPAHISEIADYVFKFRQTNEFNIMGNLKFDTKDKFLFLNSSYVGLKSKDYNPKDLRINKINLNLFRRTYNRMFSNNIAKMTLDEFIKELAKKNKVSEIQIRSIITKKIKKNRLSIGDNDTLIKYDNNS